MHTPARACMFAAGVVVHQAQVRFAFHAPRPRRWAEDDRQRWRAQGDRGRGGAGLLLLLCLLHALFRHGSCLDRLCLPVRLRHGPALWGRATLVQVERITRVGPIPRCACADGHGTLACADQPQLAILFQKVLRVAASHGRQVHQQVDNFCALLAVWLRWIAPNRE